jgi:hypothetical protein
MLEVGDEVQSSKPQESKRQNDFKENSAIDLST